MALIAKCRKCRRQVPLEAESCPFCGRADGLRFIAEYWPRGRSAGRKQLTLPTRAIKEARFIWANLSQPKGQESPRAILQTVGDLFPGYLEWCSLHRKPRTRQDIASVWENQLRGMFGALYPADVGTGHYTAYQKLRTVTVSNRTINKELDYFSGFLRYCRREKKIAIDRIEYDPLPYDPPPPIILSRDEVERILTESEKEPVHHAFLLCLYEMGLRISSARGMRVEDFDPDNRCVRFVQKGGKWELLPLSKRAVKAIERVIKLRKAEPGEFIFSVRKNRAPLQNIRRALDRFCKAAKVTKKVNPHLFRHSFGTHLIMKGVPTETARGLLGHAQITTTQRYLHMALEQLREAQDMVVATGKGNDFKDDRKASIGK